MYGSNIFVYASYSVFAECENAALSPIPFFQTDLVERLDREAVEAPKDAFRQRAYAWRGRNVLRRNLAGEKPEE